VTQLHCDHSFVLNHKNSS